MKSIIITGRNPMSSRRYPSFMACSADISSASLVITLNESNFKVVKDHHGYWVGSVMPLSELPLFISRYAKEYKIDLAESLVDYALIANGGLLIGQPEFKTHE